MKRPRNTLKTYFQKGKKPTEEQFGDLLDSYTHKDDSVPIDNVEGLRGALDSKLDQGAESELIKVFDEKLEEAKNTINKAYLGIATPASTAPLIGSFWFRVESGNIATFQNLKDSSGNPISTIAEDFEKDGALYDVTIEIKDGVAKKELSQKATGRTPQWSNKPYNKGSQVFHEGCIWEANAVTTGANVPGVSDRWDIKLIGLNITESNDLIQFTSKNGVDLFHVDKDGYFYAMYYPNSIPVESITGLSDYMDKINPGIFTSAKSSNDLIEITDAIKNSILIKFLEDGTVYIPKLKTDESPESILKSEELFAGTYFYIPDPGMIVLDFSIVIPRNADEKNEGIVRFKAGNQVLLTARCTLQPQGNGSMSYDKKGFTLDLLNKFGKKLIVKIGSLPGLDSYHLKAYYTDSTKSKDIFGARLWQQMTKARPYPENLTKILNTGISPGFDITRYSADAKFSLDGVPAEFYLQGTFKGQYVLRLKKDKANYAINTSNQNHLLIDSQITNVGLGGKEYVDFNAVAVDYEIRSPKSPNATAKANIFRLFSYMQDIAKGTQLFTGTHQNYIVFNAWADWLIMAEVIGHWDNMQNNAMYISYDGKLWQPCPIDMDLTLGVSAGGKLINPDNAFYMGNKDIWPKFRTQLKTELAARYAFLRSTILKKENLASLFNSISGCWPQSTYEAELKKWGCITLPEALDTNDNIINFMSYRLDRLDTQFV